MTQTARPTGDAALNGWKNQAGAAVNVYQSIDETVESDADYAVSPAIPGAAQYKVNLSPLEDPGTDTGLVLRYSIGKPAGVAAIDVTVVLRCTAGGGTTIATFTHTDIPVGPTLHEQTLAAVDVANIADFAALALWITADAQ